MDGPIDQRQMDGQTDQPSEQLMDGPTDGQMDQPMAGQTNRPMKNEWTDGPTKQPSDGRMDLRLDTTKHQSGRGPVVYF